MKLKNLIENLKNQNVLKNEKLEEALRKVRREDFVPKKHKKHAYANYPLPIGENQTISQPLVVVKMTQWLNPEAGDKILEIGAGSGWQAGLIGYMVGRKGKIYTLERHHSLAEFARANLKRAGIENIKVIEKDGSTGYKEGSPYNGIIVTAASPEITEEWKTQLEEGGRIVAPIGRHIQTMVYGVKKGKGIEIEREERGYRFVPLKGKKGF